MRKVRLPLHWQILIAIGLAVLAGWISGPHGSLFGISLPEVYDFIGGLFLRALQMLVVPLILSAVILSVARLGKDQSFARLGAKTFGYYIITSLIAICVGLVLVNLIRPGHVAPEVSDLLKGLAKTDIETVSEHIEGRSVSELAQIFYRMIPTNVFSVMADNREMLGLIVFGLLFGYFTSRLPNEKHAPFLRWWDSFYDVIMMLTDMVIRFAPLGVFGLVAKTVATTGFDTLVPLLRFAFCVLLGLLIHMFVILPLLLRFFGVSARRHFTAMSSALLTAFTTSSSNATLPLTMECLEKNAGVSEKIRGFVIPLGANVNMDGTALYECVAAMFIAQIYGIELGFGVQLTVVILALFTSIGVAGVPAASLVAIAIILNAIGLPLEGIGMILAVDRILDMCRTSVNVYGDTCGAVIIARSEGEKLSYGRS